MGGVRNLAATIGVLLVLSTALSYLVERPGGRLVRRIRARWLAVWG